MVKKNVKWEWFGGWIALTAQLTYIVWKSLISGETPDIFKKCKKIIFWNGFQAFFNIFLDSRTPILNLEYINSSNLLISLPENSQV